MLSRVIAIVRRAAWWWTRRHETRVSGDWCGDARYAKSRDTRWSE